MERTLILDTIKMSGKKIKIAGWVHVRRDHGKIVFVDVADRTGILQVVGKENLSSLKPQYAVEIVGTIQKRPEGMINGKIPTGKVELAAEEVKVLSEAEEMPFDMAAEDLALELPTLLDYRSLTLRHPKQKAIFKVQAAIAESFREAAVKLGCVEIFAPTIAASATEGGAEVFKVDYYGHDAYLVQSPQLYKQIMVGALERVYIFSHAYRAEPSVTTRHLAEVVQLDCEIGFVEKFEDLLEALEFTATETIKRAAEKCKEELKFLGVESPLIPKSVPKLKLREAQEIIEKRTGRNLKNELDLNPDDEIEIWKWAKEEHKSDFVIITHFPTKKRAFYTMPDPVDPEFSLSYDVIFKGLEICSGSQRINDYNQLLEVMKERKISPSGFEIYLQAFKYGLPPEGGFSYGLERMTMKLLNLSNVREASLFPRDMERADIRLSAREEK